MKRVSFIILVFVLFSPVLVLARIGVGVGTGKIMVDQPLNPGLIHTLPSLSVLNTGDEPGRYSVSVEYHEGQEEREDMGLKPDKNWFSFEPLDFYLEPGQVQQVKIRLTLPLKGAKPGDYFAYLSGHPIQETEVGVTIIGVAAAAKLYFTIAPANIFQGIYYRLVSLYNQYYPWSAIVLAMIFVASLITIFRRKFKIQIAKK